MTGDASKDGFAVGRVVGSFLPSGLGMLSSKSSASAVKFDSFNNSESSSSKMLSSLKRGKGSPLSDFAAVWLSSLTMLRVEF